MSALDAGKAYLQQVLEKLPPEARAQAEATFMSAEAAAALTTLGEGVLRQQDYSRQMDALRADKDRAQAVYTQNLSWFEENKAALEQLPTLQTELEALKARPPAAPAAPAAPPATPVGDGYVKTDQLQGLVQETLGLFAVVPTLILDHQRRFNETLSEEQMIGLIQQAQTNSRSLKAQYAITFGEKIAAKAAEDKAAYEEKLRQEGEARARAANPNLPYPVRPTGTSPLDSLSAPDRPGLPTPDALAAEYEQLVAGKA